MNFKAIPFGLLLAVAACGNGTNPLFNKTPTTTDDGTGIKGDRAVPLPSGPVTPSASAPIRRSETEDGTGNGYAKDVSYDATTDTFSVDNLGFDGDNAYARGTAVGSLGPYAVYESDTSFSDPVTGTPISQFLHRAIYGVDADGDVQLAIIRTGAYIGYGFGGFVYQRNGTITLPTSGQASFSGDYAGLRDFDGRGGLEYTTGDMTMAVDFNDFDSGSAVQGRVSNRVIYDINGTDITASVLTALSTDAGVTVSVLPSLVFTVSSNVLDRNGEVAGKLGSYYTDSTGAIQTLDSGNYYAILSDNSNTGDTANKVVGVLVVEGDDKRTTGVKVRETGGFILYRN